MLGGFSGNKEITEDVKGLITKVKPDVEKQLDTTFDTFEAHSVKTQVVAGTNYKAKVHVGDDEYVHLTVHEPLPHTKEPPKLLSAEGGKALGDDL